MMSSPIFGSIRRKALAVLPTKCRYCFRVFNDKYYKDETTHKVICPHCGKKNAEISFDEAMRTVAMWGLRHDVGTAGEFGFHFSYAEIKKFFVEIYGEQLAEKKMNELLYSISVQKQRKKQLEESMKNEKRTTRKN